MAANFIEGRLNMATGIEYIPSVEALDMPAEVEAYCDAHDISTHYATEMVWIVDDGNPFAEWLKSLGYVFKSKPGETDRSAWVGVFGT